MTPAPIVPLPDLSDESPQRHVYSPRLDAVLRRLPKYNRVRIRNAIYNAGIDTLAELLALKRTDLQRWKNLGKKSITDLEQTLAFFGVWLTDAVVPIVVAEQALPIDAHVQQLQRWIDERLEHCEHGKGPEPAGSLAIERQVLTDVMLILDGRPPAVRVLDRLDNPHWLRDQIAELEADCDIKHNYYWKRQLKRILAGITSAEDIADRSFHAPIEALKDSP